jgi:hypothetical protein
MVDQGNSFGNLLNNPLSFDWANMPNAGFKGGDFQSLLKPSEATTPGDWNSTPQRRLEYMRGLEKQGYSKEQITSALASSENESIGNLLGTVSDIARQNAYWQSGPGMREQLEMGKEMAKEQAKQTLKYQTIANTVANLPGQIERAFAADKYYQGMSQIPEIYRGTFASVPSMNIQAPGYSAPQVRYFS